MQNDWERNNVIFHNRASNALNSLFEEFKASTATINRLRDENVFQQQLGLYSNRLKHHLDSIASEMLNHAEPATDRNQWNHILSNFIHDYMQEFRQKTKSL